MDSPTKPTVPEPPPLPVPVPTRIEVEIADPDDRDALVTIYSAFDGPNWTHSDNWLSDLTLGAWHGVETDDTRRVTSLKLADNELNGGIPPPLGRLANLQWLGLGLNQLSGTVPPDVGPSHGPD